MKVIQEIPSRVPNEYRSLKDYLSYYKQDDLAGKFSVFMDLFNAFDLENGNDYQLDLIGNIINRDRLYEAKIKVVPAPTPAELTTIYRKILKATIIKETAQYGSVNEIYECLALVFPQKGRTSFRVVDNLDMTVSIFLLFEPDPLDLIITKYLREEIVPIAMGRELTAFGVLSTGAMVGRQSVGDFSKNTSTKRRAELGTHSMVGRQSIGEYVTIPPVAIRKEVGFYPPEPSSQVRYLIP